MDSFNQLQIKQELISATVDMGFSTPTPIQRDVIPHMLEGKDCLAKAPTGSGKTCAFALPALDGIDISDGNVQVLVMCPTRELVMQTEGEFNKLAKYLRGARILAIYGGQNLERQLAALRRKPQIVVGTPGRIMDHLRRKTLKLENLKLLVLDEADEMLNMGFREDIDTILLSASSQHQTVLFSATMSRDILRISKSYQVSPVSVEVEADSLPKIDQHFVLLNENEKLNTLAAILDEKCYNLVLVFCNTKAKVDSLSDNLNRYGYRAEALHGDLRQRERDRIMKRYRGGDIDILVATDVAARGIDVGDIEAIFNYDIPHDDEYYVHRIGRTARAGKTGEAFCFFSNRDASRKKELEKFMGVKMKKYENDFDDNSQSLAAKKSNFAESSKSESQPQAVGAPKLTGDENQALKEFMSAALKEFNKKENKNYSYRDLHSVLQGLGVTPSTSGGGSDRASSRPERMERSNGDRDSRPEARGFKTKTSQRYFINVGLKDNLTESSLSDIITSNTTIDSSAIREIKLLETFSFIEIDNGNDEDALSLSGSKIGKRVISIEHADTSQRDSRASKPRNFSSGSRSGGFGGGSRNGGSSFGGGRSGGFSSRNEGGSDRGERSFSSDGGEKRSSFGRSSGGSSFGGNRSGGFSNRNEGGSSFSSGRSSFSSRSEGSSERGERSSSSEGGERSSSKSSFGGGSRSGGFGGGGSRGGFGSGGAKRFGKDKNFTSKSRGNK